MNSNSNCVVLYQVYGKKNLFNQVLFSILTLHYFLQKEKETFEIVVYTDNPHYFKAYQTSLNLKLETLTAQQIEEFKGEDNFVHRVKICVIKDCLAKYKKNVFYLDSDTYFNQSPLQLISQIDSETSIMNTNDYDLQNAEELYENGDWLKIRRAIRDYEYEVDGKVVKIPLSTRMWNAGIIGISYENKNLVDDVLKLTDQIYKNKKVFTVEQFAFSYCLQNKTRLITTGDVITHYWPNHIGMYWKNQYDDYISRFLRENKFKSVDEQAAKAFDLTKQHQQIIAPPKLTKIDKIVKRINLVWKVATTGKV